MATRLFRFIVLIGVVSGLTACASVSPQKFVGPDGKDAYSMRCSGMGRDMQACYKAAGEVCPQGYTIIGQTSGTVIVPTGMGIVGAPKEDLAIQCK